jgi:hypothetical protein
MRNMRSTLGTLAAIFKIKPRAWEPDAGLPASTCVIRIYDFSRCRSDGAQIFSRGFARLWISNNLERDLLSLVEPVHASAFDRADVHEHILAAVIRLDESVALLAVEPLHGSLRHVARLSGTCVMRAARQRGQFVRDLEEGRQSDAECAARPSRSAETRLAPLWSIAAWAARAATHGQARSHAQRARAVRKCS